MTKHPGAVLAAHLHNLDIRPAEFGRLSKIGRGRVSELMSGRRNITPLIALKLEAMWPDYVTADVWLSMQGHYDLAKLRAKAKR